MSDGVTFRSSVNGFNRSEVIKYIEALLNEKEELASKVEELTRLCEEKESQAEAFRAELSEEKKRCETCEVASKAEAKLGAAMLEAKRFSESLVKNAEERSSAVFAAATKKAVEATSTADDIVDRLNGTISRCNDTISGVLGDVNEIKGLLSAFVCELSADGEQAPISDAENITAANRDGADTENGAVRPDGAVNSEIETEASEKNENNETKQSVGLSEKDPLFELFPDFDGTGSSSDIFDASFGEKRFVTEEIGGDENSDGKTDDEAVAGGFIPDFNFDDDGFTVNVSLDD